MLTENKCIWYSIYQWKLCTALIRRLTKTRTIFNPWTAVGKSAISSADDYQKVFSDHGISVIGTCVICV